MFFTRKAIANFRKKNRNDETGWSLLVDYKLDIEQMRKFDDLIIKTVGKKEDGSGSDFKTRDISFSFKTEADARKAGEKLNKLKSKIKGLKTQVEPQIW
jgi:hypothetical protein